MRLSVIIPVRADPRLTRCLAGLDRQAVPPDAFEVIVVDDEGSSEVAAIVASHRARYLVHAGGGSYAARAAGAAVAAGQVLVFTDADCEPARNWLATVDALFADPSCLVATGPSGAATDSAVSRWVQAIDEDRWQRLLESDRVAFCDTRNLALRKEVLAAVPFDPAFRHAGDIDLGIRLFAAGIPIRLADSLRVVHDHPRSLLAVHRRAMRRGRGLEMLDRKHGIRTGPTGQRPVRIAGRDMKRAVLRWTRLPGLRWIAVVALGVAVTALMAVLAVMAHVPGPRCAGAGPVRAVRAPVAIARPADRWRGRLTAGGRRLTARGPA